MKNVIGIDLGIVALILGYLGVTQIQESTDAVKFLGIELRAEDKGSKEAGYIQLSLGLVSLAAGIYLIGKRNK